MKSQKLNVDIGEEIKRLSKLIIILCLFMQNTGCTTASNGAINKSVSQKEPAGFKIWDRYLETNHIYGQPVIINHQEGLSLYCKKHRKWETIKAFWNPTEDNYYYVVSNHRRWNK